MRVLLELLGGVAFCGLLTLGALWLSRNITLRDKD
jgi:hypothetical protein